MYVSTSVMTSSIALTWSTFESSQSNRSYHFCGLIYDSGLIL